MKHLGLVLGVLLMIGCSEDVAETVPNDDGGGAAGGAGAGGGSGGTGGGDGGMGGMCADPPCDPPTLEWEHVSITIDDPIVNGTSLMTPIDGISFAFVGQELVTSFGRDFNNPNITFFWHLDAATGTHSKKTLSGQVFAMGTELCAGEDWCQMIGRNGTDWVVVGPAAPDMMRVSSGYTASLVAVSGPQPPASFINHSHRFSGTELFLFGATGPSGFADTVYALDMQTASWSMGASGLPQTDDNCLAHDPATNTLYSIAGRTTADGGNTTTTVDTFLVIDLDAGTYTSHPLPAAIGARQSMSCTFDPQRGLVYAFGGAVVTDIFNDALNTFHNDLWVFDPEGDSWTNVIPDSEGGMLGAPDEYGDQRFEGFSDGPNFGKNRGLMQLDADQDRLLLMGAVPIFTHEQLYVLPLAALDAMR